MSSTRETTLTYVVEWSQKVDGEWTPYEASVESNSYETAVQLLSVDMRRHVHDWRWKLTLVDRTVSRIVLVKGEAK